MSSNGAINKHGPSTGENRGTITGFQFYGDTWGKPHPHVEPQGKNGDCIVKTPADPEKLAKYRKELAEREAKYGKR